MSPVTVFKLPVPTQMPVVYNKSQILSQVQVEATVVAARVAGSGLQVQGFLAGAGRRLISNIPALVGGVECAVFPVYMCRCMCWSSVSLPVSSEQHRRYVNYDYD